MAALAETLRAEKSAQRKAEKDVPGSGEPSDNNS